MHDAGKAPIVAVPPEQRQAIEGVIMEAFLAGTDDNFDRLLEVGVSTPHRLSGDNLNALLAVPAARSRIGESYC